MEEPRRGHTHGVRPPKRYLWRWIRGPRATNQKEMRDFIVTLWFLCNLYFCGSHKAKRCSPHWAYIQLEFVISRCVRWRRFNRRVGDFYQTSQTLDRKRRKGGSGEDLQDGEGKPVAAPAGKQTSFQLTSSRYLKEVVSSLHSPRSFLEVAAKGNEHTLEYCVIPAGLGLNPVSMAISATMTNLPFLFLSINKMTKYSGASRRLHRCVF